MIKSGKAPNVNLAAVCAAVESGLSRIEKDPARGIRNMLDLGAYFSRTHRQRTFFQMAQKLLERKRSQYMRLVKRTVADVDREIIKTVGINLGYFSWTQGARTIREVEASRGFNVPWSFVFWLNSGIPAGLSVAELRNAFEAGRNLGAHCFWLIVNGDRAYMEALLHICGTFKDCAFMLLIMNDCMSDELAQLIRDQRNTVVCQNSAVCADLEATAAMLHSKRLLYGLFRFYDDACADSITGGGLIDEVYRLGGQFAISAYKPECSRECRRQVHEYAAGGKQAPHNPAFIIDFFDDIATIDHNISSQSCYIEIGADGSVADRPWAHDSNINLRTHTLAEALAILAPRQAE